MSVGIRGEQGHSTETAKNQVLLFKGLEINDLCSSLREMVPSFCVEGNRSFWVLELRADPSDDYECAELLLRKQEQVVDYERDAADDENPHFRGNQP